MRGRASWFVEAMLALVLSCGALLAGALTLGLAATIGFSSWSNDNSHSRLQFTPAGEPYVWHARSVGSGWFSQGFAENTYTDLEGQPFEFPYSDESPEPAADPRIELDPGEPRYERGGWIHMVPAGDGHEFAGYWYLMPPGDSEGAYLVGYSRADNRRLGFIGTAGLSAAKPPRGQQFAALDSGMVWQPQRDDTNLTTFSVGDGVEAFSPDAITLVINCGQKVFGVDLPSGEVRTIFDTDGPPVRCVRPSKGRLLLLLDDSIELIDYGGGQSRFSLPAELRGRELTVALRADGGLTVAAGRPRVYGSVDFPCAIYVLSADGKVSPPREVMLRDAGYQEPEQLILLLAASPALQLLVSWPPDLDQRDRYVGIDSRGQYLLTALEHDRWWLAVATSLGAVLAALCWRRQSRYRLSLGQRLFWPLYVLLFGIPGWIGYRYCRRWPPIEPCPSCHRPTPRAGDTCAICNAEFPLPAAKKPEVFVSVGAATRHAMVARPASSATMRRAMTIKELRETAGIAVLATVAFLLLVGRSVEAYRIYNDAFESVPFVGREFLFWYATLGLAFALVLGWRQSGWEDLHRMYLFLLHRPASRGTLVSIKIGVGLVLLLALSAWPIPIYALWASTPGRHASPFAWSMTLPAWCCWLLLPVVYLGAFLTGLRPARLFGTKLLPLVAAGSCYYTLSSAESMWAASIGVAVAGGLFLWAILQTATRRDFG